MQPNLFIKYKSGNEENSGFDLAALGESFIGFNDIFKELFEISELKGELDVRTIRIGEGSILTEILIQALTSIPFENIKHFQDFLQFTDLDLLKNLQDYLSQLENAHKTLNDYFRENQFDLGLINTLITIYITKMINVTPEQKLKVVLVDKNGSKIPQKYAEKLHHMINERKYKRALKPITENNVAEIQISDNKIFKESIIINDVNFEDYLGEEEKILPELQNGEIHSFTGEILALQSTRGELLKFKAYGFDPRYQLLVAHPSDDRKTEDYTEFYKKEVNIKAEIYRKSLYKKPELILLEIELVQQKML